MITLIVGQNAIGKSVYLKRKVQKVVQYNENIIFNMLDTTYLTNREYNSVRIKALEEVLGASINTSNNDVIFIETDEIKIRKPFNEILTLICKEGTELYLDEPEYKLNSREIGYLVAFLYRILDTFQYIEIVTHSELFLSILEAEVKTIKIDTDCDFVVSELEEDAYATID